MVCPVKTRSRDDLSLATGLESSRCNSSDSSIIFAVYSCVTVIMNSHHYFSNMESYSHSQVASKRWWTMNYTCQRVSFEKAWWGFIQFHHYRIIVGCNTCHMYKRIQSLVSWFSIVDINIYKTESDSDWTKMSKLERHWLCEGFFLFVFDKNSEKLLQPPLLSVDYKQTLRPCSHSRGIGKQNPWKRISSVSGTRSVVLKRSFNSSVKHRPWASWVFKEFCKWVIQRRLLSIKSFSLQNQSFWRRNAACPVNIREAGLDLEPLSTDSRPRESAPNNKVKSQDSSHFAVCSPFSIMLICSDFSDIIKNQISLEMKKLNLDH